MTDHDRSFQNPVGAPDAPGLATRLEELFVAPRNRAGGRPPGRVQRPARIPYNLRAPELGETGLSAAEIQHAISIRVLAVDDETDLLPAVHRFVPAGGWGIKAKGLQLAGPFDWLTA